MPKLRLTPEEIAARCQLFDAAAAYLENHPFEDPTEEEQKHRAAEQIRDYAIAWADLQFTPEPI